MVGPPYSAKLCGGFFVSCACSGSAVSQHSALILGTEEDMDATTIFVIVIIALFLVAMVAFQVYIHTGKKEETADRHDRRA